MGAITQVTGAPQTLTETALDGLINGAFVIAGVIDNTVSNPLDVILQVKVTPGTVAANKQVVVFAQGSLDGVDYQTGPTSGTAVTDEPNLTFLGTIPVNTPSGEQINLFEVSPAYGGVLPRYVRIIVKNDSGATLAASGHYVKFSEVTGASA